jgi:uncharacterized protein YbaA (DUF1428 family)
MIITDEMDIARNVVVKSPDGRMATNIKEFNTETEEAVIYAMIVYDDKSTKTGVIGKNLFDGTREIVTFNCHLLGYKAYYRDTGKEFNG